MRLPPSKLRRQREPIGPLVDVVFLLLVFFLLAGTLEPSHPIEVDPPESVHVDPEDIGPLRILLDAEGRIGFAGEALDMGALATALGARTDLDVLSQAVQVEADGDAAAGLVFALLKQLRSLGFQHLKLVTRPRRSTAGGDG
jgi:biopolymer transport protein ExbD